MQILIALEVRVTVPVMLHARNKRTGFVRMFYIAATGLAWRRRTSFLYVCFKLKLVLFSVEFTRPLFIK